MSRQELTCEGEAHLRTLLLHVASLLGVVTFLLVAGARPSWSRPSSWASLQGAARDISGLPSTSSRTELQVRRCASGELC